MGEELRHACLYCGAWVKRGRPYCGCGKALPRNVAGGRFRIETARAVDTGCIRYAGVDTDTRRPVCTVMERPGAPADAVRGIVRESRFLRKHGGRAPFPRFLTSGRLPGTGLAFTVSELVEGVTLREAVKDLTPTSIVETWLSCAEALAQLHALGGVHCNLSPDGFIVTPSGKVFLADFRHITEAGQPGRGDGVPGFKAPEQFVPGERVGSAADVFALGACLYESLTGVLPYPPSAKKGLERPGYRPKRASILNPEVPHLVDEVLMRALDRAPVKRYADADAMRSELAEAFANRTEVDGLDIEFAAWYENMLGVFAGAFGLLCRALAAVLRASARLLGFFLRPLVLLPGRVKAVVLVCAVTCLFLVGGSVWMRTGEAACQTLSWPASDVYVNGVYAGEAPSPETVSLPAGRNRVRFVGRQGSSVELGFWCWPGKHYIVIVDIENKAFLIEERN